MITQKTYYWYFDVLKGIAITLMVMGHIVLFSFGINPSVSAEFLYFNMPLFFYMSGYLAYKRIDTFKAVGEKLLSRGMVLLFPYIVFLSLYGVFSGSTHIVDSMIGGGGRYWFLYTLFIISAFFVVYEYITRKVETTWISVALWLLPLLVLVSMKLYISRTQNGGGDLYNVITGMTNYYRYFLVGYLCKKYCRLNRFLFENDLVCAFGVVAYFLNWYFFEYHNILLIFTGTLGAIIALQTFVKRFLTGNNKLTNLLIAVGKCSLGIYVIHYFFIPDISAVTQDFIDCGNPFIWQLLFAVLLAIPLVAASMFVYKLIEMNRWLQLLCFGRKSNK